MSKKKLNLQVARRPGSNPDSNAMRNPVDVRVGPGELTLSFTTGGDQRTTGYTIDIGTDNLAALLTCIGEAMQLQHKEYLDEWSRRRADMMERIYATGAGVEARP